MIVNNVDLVTTYGVTIISKEIQNSQVINYADWLENSIDPVKLKEERFQFSSINVTLLIEGGDETEVLTKISNILILCKSGELKFSDMDYYYNFSLNDNSNKKICPVSYELTLQLKAGYKYLGEVTKTYSNVSTIALNYEGNTDTRAIIEITPSIGIVDLVITGLTDSAFTVHALEMNKKLIIDVNSVTVDGINKFNDVQDMWEFPRLKPGTNNISLSNANCSITIKYKPRWV